MRIRAILVVVAISTTITAGTFAQSAKSPSTEPQKGSQMMSMDDMMKQCRDHCSKASKSMDETMKMMNDAKQSNDVNKMRAAMDQMQKPMADMKQHMNMCMSMMDMMQKMGGMMGEKKK